MQSNPPSNQNSKPLHKVQKNLYEQAMIGFAFTSDWLRKWAEFLSQSLRVVIKENAKILL